MMWVNYTENLSLFYIVYISTLQLRDMATARSMFWKIQFQDRKLGN